MHISQDIGHKSIEVIFLKQYSRQELLIMNKAIYAFIAKHPNLPDNILNALLARADILDTFIIYSI